LFSFHSLISVSIHWFNLVLMFFVQEWSCFCMSN
jgi:hypothetical protein